jgi:hypothetical protein
MDPTQFLGGQRPVQTMPLKTIDLSSDESDVEDAPPRVNGVNGVEHLDEVEDGSDQESDDGWDLDSLVEDAILELSDEQMRERKYSKHLKRQRAKNRS